MDEDWDDDYCHDCGGFVLISPPQPGACSCGDPWDRYAEPDDELDDGPWDTSQLTYEDLDPLSLRPGEPPKPITTAHLPGDRDG